MGPQRAADSQCRRRCPSSRSFFWLLALSWCCTGSLADNSLSDRPLVLNDAALQEADESWNQTSLGNGDLYAFDQKGSGKRRPIIFLFIVSVLLLIGMFLYQRWAWRRMKESAKDMLALQTTDQYLIKILQNFSMTQEYKFRGLQPKKQSATLSFEKLGATVKTESQEQKSVLCGITGSFEAGHLSAIMGPSGAGKTTFLNVLCGKTRNDNCWTVEGQILVNNKPESMKSLTSVTGFVPQDDIVHEGLTVRENIAFSAMMRSPRSFSRERIKRIVEDVLQVLQLEPQQNLLVGSRVRGNGLSGGQRKRVNVGIELAASPTVLFLDEPTSGLDSTSSLILVQQLRRMAQLVMTIVMVIHQPRYSLFTLLDDVLLLGKGGKAVYIGPTKDAKKYFENLGIMMPPDENPADWMMDVLSGQVDPQYSRIPKSDLPAKLFEAWAQFEIARDGHRSHPDARAPMRRFPSIASGRGPSDEDDYKSICCHLKEAWSRVAPDAASINVESLGKVLAHCTGSDPDQDIVEAIMRRATRFATADLREDHDTPVNFNDRSPTDISDLEITELQMERYLCHFRGLADQDTRLKAMKTSMLLGESESTGSGSSSSESDPDGSDEDLDVEASKACRCHWAGKGIKDDDLHRVQNGFRVHFCVVLHSAMIQFWRKLDVRTMFLGIVVFAGIFLAVFDRFVFLSPKWSPYVFVNSQISIALLTSVYCLRAFSEDQPMYWREASHGLNRAAFLVGRALVDTLDWLLMIFFFVMTYYLIAEPELGFYIYIFPYILVGYVASGWGYAIACVVPTSLGAFLSALLSFTLGGILGLPQEMDRFLDGGFFEIMVDVASFTRWSAAMNFFAYVQAEPPDTSQMDMIDRNLLPLLQGYYEQAAFVLPLKENTTWWTGTLALLIQGTVLRVVAYLGLRFTNRSRQI